VPALGLAVLAPLVGEYLLGNIPMRDIAGLAVLVPLYGGGAVVVREVARRTGRGWPTILLLAAAYGVIEPAAFDGSLFNPTASGLDETATHLPALGISASAALHYVVGHAVWSITVPIVLVEALVPGRRTTPWLGRVGLAVAATGYLLAGLLIRHDAIATGDYITSVPQLAATAVVVAVLIAVAFGPRGAAAPTTGPAPAPRPLTVGIAGFVGSSVFFAKPDTWVGFAAAAVMVPAAAIWVSRLSRRSGWSDAHRVALAGGTLLTYAWGGFVLTQLLGNTRPIDLAGNVVFALGAIVLVTVTSRRSDADANPDSDANPDAASGDRGADAVG
jgi:hypothetical protein